MGKLFATTERQWRSCVDCVSCMPLPAWAYITFRRAFFNCTVCLERVARPHTAHCPLSTVWTAQFPVWHNHTLTHLTDYDLPYMLMHIHKDNGTLIRPPYYTPLDTARQGRTPRVKVRVTLSLSWQPVRCAPGRSVGVCRNQATTPWRPITHRTPRTVARKPCQHRR